MDLYFERCDGTSATIEAFLACFADASGQDMAAFKLWYEQAGTPHLTAHRTFDPATGILELTLSQAVPPTPGQPSKKPAPTPVRMGFVSPQGAPLPAMLDGENDAPLERTLVLDSPQQTWRFADLPHDAIPSLLRGFSAPVVLEDGLSDSERLVLMAHDPDAFVRWESGDRLARACILQTANAIAANQPVPEIDGFVRAFGGILGRAAEDPAFAALALRLPEADELMRDMVPADPAALVAACGSSVPGSVSPAQTVEPPARGGPGVGVGWPAGGCPAGGNRGHARRSQSNSLQPHRRCGHLSLGRYHYGHYATGKWRRGAIQASCHSHLRPRNWRRWATLPGAGAHLWRREPIHILPGLVHCNLHPG